MNYIDLFSGIGGFALGAYWAGMKFERHYFSEVEPYAVELYQKRFPDAIPLGNITKQEEWNLEKGEYIITGGVPCQPHSWIGRRKGKADPRYLWPEMYKCIQTYRPLWSIIENVPGIISDGTLDSICADLEDSNYSFAPLVFPAASLGAPHIRYRVFIVSNLEGVGREQGYKNSRGSGEGTVAQEERIGFTNHSRWQTEPAVRRMAHGIPRGMERLRGLGNAVVPQKAELLFRQIMGGEN